MSKNTHIILCLSLVIILRGYGFGQKRIPVPNGEVVLLSEKDVKVNPYYVHFKNWTTADGFLGNGSYRFLAKDTLGYLWFWHEQEGLFRYNGLSYKIFSEADGFRGSEMRQATTDKMGNLWFATTSGLWQYNIKTGQFANFINELSGDKSFGSINALPNGTFWVSTTGQNNITWIFDPQKKQFLHQLSIVFSHAENNRQDTSKYLYVYGPVYIDRDSFAWFWGRPSGPEELYSIDLRQNTGKGYEMSKMYWQDGLHSEKKEMNSAMVVFADSDSIHFWVGYWFGGLRKYNKKTGFWTQYTAKNQQVNHFNTELILSIAQKNADELWINGYAIFNKKTESYTVFPPDPNQPFSFRKDNITLHIEPDGYHGYWAVGEGVTHFAPSAQRFMVRSLSARGVLKGLGCYDAEHKRLLLPFGGTEKKAIPSIVSYNEEAKKVEQKFFPELAKMGAIDNNIIKILAAKKKKGSYWVITPNQLFELNTTTLTLKHHPLRFKSNDLIDLRDIDEDTEGVLWLARADYSLADPVLLLSYNPYNKNIALYTKKQPQNASWLTFPYAQSVFCDSKGFVWVGSAAPWQGLNILNPKTNQVNSYQFKADDPKSLPSDIVTKFVEDVYGRVWLKTDAGFCFKTTESSTFERVAGFKGVGNNFVFDKKGHLWVGNAKGLFCYDTLNRQWRGFNERHGLINYSNSIILNEDSSRLFLGTDVEFDPSFLAQKAPPPNIVIESFNVFDKPLPLPTLPHFAEQITLKYDQNFFSIGFIGIGFHNPEETQYAYQLVGVDQDWVYSGTRKTAFYTNIGAGDYGFRVKAMNADGVWSDVKVLKISVLPPFWQTWWFRVLAAAIVLGSLWFFYQYRLRQVRLEAEVKQKEAELLQKETEFRRTLAETEMSALRAQMNPHFIFNCLNSINNYMLDNDGKKASLYLTKFARLIRLVLENSRTEKVSLENEMAALELYIEMEALRFKQKLRYEIHVAPSVQTDFINIPPLLLQPYVENAIWHGLMHRKEGGNVRVAVTQPNENTLHIEITDDGIGRQAAMELKSRSAMRQKSFGMQITSERIKAINDIFGIQTTVTIQDLENTEGEATGTKVIIEIPC